MKSEFWNLVLKHSDLMSILFRICMCYGSYRLRDINRGFVNLAISRRPEIVGYHTRMHVSCKQCRTAIIISVTVIWKVWLYGQSVKGRLHAFQHAHCLIFTSPSKQTSSLSQRRWQRGWRASWVARTAMPCPRPRHVSQQRCADRKVWSASVHGVWPKIHVRRP